MSEAGNMTERYTLRRKVFKFFGAGFHVYDSEKRVVAYCKQKAFRLREDVRLYTSEACAEELLRIDTSQVIDFSAVYRVWLPTGEKIGEFKRRGVRSMFRDEWAVFDGEGREIGKITEDSGWLALFRRLHEAFALLSPEKFDLTLTDGRVAARYRTHWDPFVYRLGVAVLEEDHAVDDLMILAGACLLGAIEGRQG